MRRQFGLVLIALLLPAAASAKQSTEHVRAGVMLSVLPGKIPLGEVSVRVSLPMGDKAGVDIDVGKLFGTKRLTQGSVPTYRVVSHVKWLHSGRSENGFAGYLHGGPQLVFVRQVGGREQRRMFSYEWGYGLDWGMDNGVHTGFEFAYGGGIELLYLSGFLLAGPKK